MAKKLSKSQIKSRQYEVYGVPHTQSEIDHLITLKQLIEHNQEVRDEYNKWLDEICKKVEN